MFNKAIILGTAALAALAFASPALAAGPVYSSVNVPLPGQNTLQVPVNINVVQTVGLWDNAESIDLTMNGSGPNNATAAYDPDLYMISNVAADVSATVSGALPTGVSGVNFFLFPNQTDAAAVVATINSNAGGTADQPAGALAWSSAQVTAGNVSHPIVSNVLAQGGQQIPMIYAADASGGAPTIGTTNVLVTYTIAAH